MERPGIPWAHGLIMVLSLGMTIGMTITRLWCANLPRPRRRVSRPLAPRSRKLGTTSLCRGRGRAPRSMLPNSCPPFSNLNDWVTRVTSGYGDRKEVRWFEDCNDANRSFDSFEDSAGVRLCALDDMLGHGVQGIAHTNTTFQRELTRTARREYNRGRLLAGRHSAQDLITVEWIGDSPLQVPRLRDQLLKVSATWRQGYSSTTL